MMMTMMSYDHSVSSSSSSSSSSLASFGLVFWFLPGFVGLAVDLDLNLVSELRYIVSKNGRGASLARELVAFFCCDFSVCIAGKKKLSRRAVRDRVTVVVSSCVCLGS
ncbi:hypothetical protein EX30DRAFT_72759 [Ascodesmis nigricans]|uniref:Uncharacterized protein n=1 Tax=Ascodesmis nigricans TaxID=341454 RepID=A0A4S2MU04_9PEZI|nr:hypothetical protein EX30DRAFT_72759 [Ascodesmis nigricans]